MRIALVSDWFLKLVVPGQAVGLRELGHDVVLVCRNHALEFGGDRDERDAALAAMRGAGVGVVELEGARFRPGGWSSLPRARRALSRWRPDVVSAHENSDPRLWLLSRPYPLIYTVHDPEPHPGAPLHPVEAMVSRAWLRAADRLVVHGSELIAALPQAASRADVTVIPHGINVRSRPLPAPTVKAVVCFGRLQPYKGISVLVAAMRSLWEEGVTARLVIAGTGPSADEVPNDPRIEFRNGYIPEQDVETLLSEATVMVLPYVQASQSGVGLLSLAHGIPTVVTRVGALPDLALDARFLAEPADPRSLAVAIRHALHHPGDRRLEILRFTQNRFGWPAVSQQYEDLYSEVLSSV